MAIDTSGSDHLRRTLEQTERLPLGTASTSRSSYIHRTASIAQVRESLALAKRSEQALPVKRPR